MSAVALMLKSAKDLFYFNNPFNPPTFHLPTFHLPPSTFQPSNLPPSTFSFRKALQQSNPGESSLKYTFKPYIDQTGFESEFS